MRINNVDEIIHSLTEWRPEDRTNQEALDQIQKELHNYIGGLARFRRFLQTA
jgi:hypothetical protein